MAPQEDGNNTAFEAVQIMNRYGLHGRPTTMFVKLANSFESEIRVSCDEDEEVDGKSAISILSLGLEFGRTLNIRATGADATAAVSALAHLVRNKFAED